MYSTEADQRAHALLLRFLTPVQRKQFQEAGWFEVTGSAGVRYRIQTGTHRYVCWMAGGSDRVFSVLGGWLRGVPEFDCMLAQKMILETDEPFFRAIACGHNPYHPEQVPYDLFCARAFGKVLAPPPPIHPLVYREGP